VVYSREFRGSSPNLLIFLNDHYNYLGLEDLGVAEGGNHYFLKIRDVSRHTIEEFIFLDRELGTLVPDFESTFLEEVDHDDDFLSIDEVRNWETNSSVRLYMNLCDLYQHLNHENAYLPLRRIANMIDAADIAGGDVPVNLKQWAERFERGDPHHGLTPIPRFDIFVNGDRLRTGWQEGLSAGENGNQFTDEREPYRLATAFFLIILFLIYANISLRGANFGDNYFNPTMMGSHPLWRIPFGIILGLVTGFFSAIMEQGLTFRKDVFQGNKILSRFQKMRTHFHWGRIFRSLGLSIYMGFVVYFFIFGFFVRTFLGEPLESLLDWPLYILSPIQAFPFEYLISPFLFTPGIFLGAKVLIENISIQDVIQDNKKREELLDFITLNVMVWSVVNSFNFWLMVYAPTMGILLASVVNIIYGIVIFFLFQGKSIRSVIDKYNHPIWIPIKGYFYALRSIFNILIRPNHMDLYYYSSVFLSLLFASSTALFLWTEVQSASWIIVGVGVKAWAIILGLTIYQRWMEKKNKNQSKPTSTGSLDLKNRIVLFLSILLLFVTVLIVPAKSIASPYQDQHRSSVKTVATSILESLGQSVLPSDIATIVHMRNNISVNDLLPNLKTLPHQKVDESIAKNELEDKLTEKLGNALSHGDMTAGEVQVAIMKLKRMGLDIEIDHPTPNTSIWPLNPVPIPETSKYPAGRYRQVLKQA